MSTKSPRYNASLARARSSSGIQQQALNSTATGPINQLTPILLLDVFAHVRSVQGLATCSLVCRQWHALVCIGTIQTQNAFKDATSSSPIADLLCHSIALILSDMDVCTRDGSFFFPKWHQPSPPCQRYEVDLPLGTFSLRSASQSASCTSLSLNLVNIHHQLC